MCHIYIHDNIIFASIYQHAFINYRPAMAVYISPDMLYLRLWLEDYLLWLNMIVSGAKLANINESLVYVRVGNGFDSKRGSQERIDGWWKLQQIMMKAGMINRFQAWMNMVYIHAFVKTPSGLKKWLYSNILRK